jgi:ATP-binding cassette subfamily B protein
MQETDFQKRKINPETWKEIFKLVKKRYKMMLVVGIGGLVWGALDVVMSLITKAAIDDYMTPMTFDGFPGFTVLVVMIHVVLLAISTWVVARAACSLESNLAADLRREAFRKLQTLSFSYFDKSAVGFLLSRLTNDISNVMDMVSWLGIDLMWSVCALLMAVVAVFLINVKLALIIIASLPIVIAVTIVFQRMLLKYSRELRRLNSMVTSGFNEGITGARTTKTLVREELNNADFTALTANMRTKSIHNGLINAAFMPVANLAISAAMGLALWQGGLDVGSTLIKVGELNFFINIGNLMFQPIRNFVGVFAQLQSMQAAAERVVDVLTSTSDVKDSNAVVSRYGDEFTANRENWEPIEGAVEFQNVSFSYKPGEPILSNFNLSVARGEKIALVGATGGGKSTIVNLVCRFYEPSEGAVLIDGVDYRQRSQLWLQSSLGYVLQSPHLFSGSIEDNIRYGRLNATDEQVRNAAAMVGAHDFISALPNGYSTEVGEGGDLLSTGQKQLISFARALLADPKIFVLDEATSSIDTESELKIRHASETMLAGRTSFIIAHRLSSIRNADRIIVIDKGEIAEMGNHRELISKRGRYFELYTQQFRRDMEDLSLQQLSAPA